MGAVNDTISDFLIRIKNAYLARHRSLEVPYVKILAEIGKILEKEGFIREIKATNSKGGKTLTIGLSYKNRKPALADVVRVSKPGLRIYVSKEHIPMVYGGFGIVILSTPKGIMTGKSARKENLGGEVICRVW